MQLCKMVYKKNLGRINQLKLVKELLVWAYYYLSLPPKSLLFLAHCATGYLVRWATRNCESIMSSLCRYLRDSQGQHLSRWSTFDLPRLALAFSYFRAVPRRGVDRPPSHTCNVDYNRLLEWHWPFQLRRL